MTDPLRGRANAFLHRLGLVAGLLSIIAGIIGMHVMSAGHGTHEPAAVGIIAEAPDGHGSHLSMPAKAVPPSDAASHHTAALPGTPCSGTGTCTDMSAMVSVCVPAPSHNTLAAPLPGSPPYALGGTAAAGAPDASYSHRPGSPSPGDLCISRT